MVKSDTLVVCIGIIILLSIILVGYTVQKNQQPTVQYYKGSGGTYRVDLIHHGSSLDYYLHTFINNKEYVVAFRKSPADVANVSMEPRIADKLDRPKGIQVVYVTQSLILGNITDQDSIIALAELGKILGRADFSVFKLNYRSAFTEEDDHTKNLQIPRITCANVTDQDAVIHLRLADETKVYSDEHQCIIIQGKNGDELIRATYKFLYHLLGVF